MVNREKFILRAKITRLKRQLEATDYKTLKWVEGLISDEEYAPIKQQRQSLRDEINSLQEQNNNSAKTEEATDLEQNQEQ